MKRTMTAVAALTLIVAACGGGDDASSEETADISTEATAESTAESTADEGDPDSAEESTTDDTGTSGADDDTADEGDPDSAEESTTDDTGTSGADDDTADDSSDTAAEPGDNTGDDDGDEPSGPEIRTLSDVPEACRDAMANFLREIEPVVEPIDWQSATMADFEQIAIEFEAKAAEFEAASVDLGCDDLNFDDDASGDILIEFARAEAPGAVDFLVFLEELSTGVAGGGDDSAAGELETCQDAIDFFQGLLDEYDSIASVPASELLKIPSIANLYADCSSEQLEFFDSPELQEFMSG